MPGSAARPPGTRPRIVVVGLGPADDSLTTPAARAALARAPVRYLRTARHPAAAPLLDAGARALDHHYESSPSFAATYAGIVAELVEAAQRHGSIAYGVPGSPLVLESTVAALQRRPEVDVELVAGISFLDLCWAALGLDPVAAGVRLVDGAVFATTAARDPGPLLVAQTYSREVLSAIKLAVRDGPREPVVFLHHLGLADEAVIEVPWDELDRRLAPDHLTCVFIPHLAVPVGHELAELETVVERLRLECPWDRVQTHRSLVRHLLEESYEVVEAIDELEAADGVLGAGEHLEEELGDVLCQVLFHAVLAREEGMFDLSDVARTVREKLVGRHPHVFADPGSVLDTGAVAKRWEEIKQAEKGRESLMDGIPTVLPALLLATKIERKARGIGAGAASDPALSPARLVAVLERFATGDDEVAGDLLFALARISADRGLDPEDLLRQEAQRFRRAFVAAERRAAEGGVGLADLDESARAALVLAAYRPA